MRNRIWIPETSLTTPNNPTLSVSLPPVRLQGLFHIEVLDAKTGQVKKEYSFSNTITNTMMNRLGARTAFIAGDALTGSDINNMLSLGDMQLGSGSTPTTGTDLRLQGPYITGGPSNNGRVNSSTNGGIAETTGYVTASVSASVSQSAYHFFQFVRLFDETVANGPVREIAVFPRASVGVSVAATASIRTLIRDENGTPVTINKTNQEQLRVRYEYRLFPPSTGSTFVTVLGTTSHSISLMPVRTAEGTVWGGAGTQTGFTRFFGGFSTSTDFILQARLYGSGSENRLYGGAPTGSPLLSGTAAVNTSASFPATYSIGDYYRDIDVFWSPAVGNFPNGIGLITLSWFPPFVTTTEQFAIQIQPAIQKGNLQRLQMRFRLSWDRSGSGNV
jgi:hypothetical protein